jgi:hypothetical protein
MGLDGLAFTSWVGWFTGIWFLNPLRRHFPKFKSFFDPFTIIPTLLSLLSSIIWLDFLLHYVPSKDRSIVRRLLTASLTSLTILTKMYLRLAFGTKFKKLCVLITQLQSYPLSSNNTKSPIQKPEKIIIGSVFLLQFVSIFFISAAVWNRRRLNLLDSWFSCLSNWQYTVFFGIFGAISNYMMAWVAFTIILIITNYSFLVLTDFCDEFERAIRLGNESLSKLSLAIYDREVLDIGTTQYRVSKVTNEFIRNSLLRQFDSIVEIFKIYDEVMGYILFGVSTLNTVLMLQRFNDFIIWNTVPTVIVFDAVSLASQFIQLGTIILLLGHKAHVIVREPNGSVVQ